MRRLAAASALAAACLFALPADASLLVTIDKSTQRMTVAQDGVVAHNWPVSTGRAGYGTPNGTFRPQRLARTWFSRKYYNSPMPYSIFFHKGYAIHGTNYISRLGGPASHGCVRLHPGNAAKLFAMVKSEGMGATRIVVTGANRPALVASKPPKRRGVAASARERNYGYGRPAYDTAWRGQYHYAPAYGYYGYPPPRYW